MSNFLGGVYSAKAADSRDAALAKRDVSALLSAWGREANVFTAQLDACVNDLAQDLGAAVNSANPEQVVDQFYMRIAALIFELSTIAGVGISSIAQATGRPYSQALQAAQTTVAHQQAQVRANWQQFHG